MRIRYLSQKQRKPYRLRKSRDGRASSHLFFQRLGLPPYSAADGLDITSPSQQAGGANTASLQRNHKLTQERRLDVGATNGPAASRPHTTRGRDPAFAPTRGAAFPSCSAFSVRMCVGITASKNVILRLRRSLRAAGLARGFRWVREGPGLFLSPARRFQFAFRLLRRSPQWGSPTAAAPRK